jgi:hypothetical protein
MSGKVYSPETIYKIDVPALKITISKIGAIQIRKAAQRELNCPPKGFVIVSEDGKWLFKIEDGGFIPSNKHNHRGHLLNRALGRALTRDMKLTGKTRFILKPTENENVFEMEREVSNG